MIFGKIFDIFNRITEIKIQTVIFNHITTPLGKNHNTEMAKTEAN
jgi:hypothetical protein